MGMTPDYAGRAFAGRGFRPQGLQSLRLTARLALLGLLGLLPACGPGSGEGLRGQVTIDGSSSTYPIAEAAAEEFQLRTPRVVVAVGRSGTRGGFERFCRGATDVATASRPITGAEDARCAANGIEYLELPVALDGLSLIVNPQNTFVDCLTVEELRRIWRPGSTVRTWRDVRAELPPVPIQLYGPGTDSGTFDFFTEAIMGEMGASRADFHASEDDNVLVRGLMGDRNSLGYFGFAYAAEYAGRLKLLGVDGGEGEGCVLPGAETIREGRYAPLSRRLFIYVNEASLQRPGTRAFMDYFMTHAPEFIPPSGLFTLPEHVYRENLGLLERAAAAAEGEAGHE
jgi:phosphate transport system substrate-binding protein